MKLMNALSFLTMILGAIHLAFSPLVIPSIYRMQPELGLLFGYMFVATGLSVLFVGWLQNQLLKHGIVSHDRLLILRGSILFLFICGLGAIGTMWSNPFAYLLFILALLELNGVRKIRYS